MSNQIIKTIPNEYYLKCIPAKLSVKQDHQAHINDEEGKKQTLMKLRIYHWRFETEQPALLEEEEEAEAEAGARRHQTEKHCAETQQHMPHHTTTHSDMSSFNI